MARKEVAFAVITASDSRSLQDDTAGDTLVSGLEKAGHRLVSRRLHPDEPGLIREAVEQAAAAGADVVIITGGTGISSRDGTYEAIDGLLEKRLPGFGELFRFLSYQEIGAAAMLSRAQAGVYRGKLIISLPGSPAACRLALRELLVPELAHMVREVSR